MHTDHPLNFHFYKLHFKMELLPHFTRIVLHNRYCSTLTTLLRESGFKQQVVMVLSPLSYTINARKEVIVSAGIFKSPQLLMISGVGPANVPQHFSIPVVKDLPGVGQNMWDHILWGTDHKVNIQTSSAALNNLFLAYTADQLFRDNASGPLSIFGASYYGFENLPQPYRGNLSSASIAPLNENFSATGDWPELEWIPVSGYLGYQEDRQTSDPRDGYNYATINTAIVSPLSRGNVSLQSASMTDPPLISLNRLTDPTDQELAIQSSHRQRQIWSDLASQRLPIGDETLPGSNVTSDAGFSITSDRVSYKSTMPPQLARWGRLLTEWLSLITMLVYMARKSCGL